LQDARINGYVYLRDVIFTDEVKMGRLQTNTFLQMDGIRLGGAMSSGGTIPSDKIMDLSGTKADYITILGGNFANTVKMDFLKVDKSIVISGSTEPIVFADQVILTNSRIDGNLYIEYSSLKSIDLSGGQIQGELLISPDVEWQKGSGDLILDNAQIGVLKCPTPDELEKLKIVSFAGCTYKRLNWVEKQSGNPLDISWPWTKKINPAKLFEKGDGVSESGSTAKQRSYSAQPYEQLASVLRTEGYTNLADDVLFDKKEAEKKSSTFLSRTWVLLSMQHYLIGYGYDYSYVFYSSAFLIVVGYLAIRFNKEGKDRAKKNQDGKSKESHPNVWCIIYSIDMLLPVLQLERRNYDIHPDGFAKYWFYIHRTAGYILATFIIAGVTGITK
jgi:hypothetical protein